MARQSQCVTVDYAQ